MGGGGGVIAGGADDATDLSFAAAQPPFQSGISKYGSSSDRFHNRQMPSSRIR